MLVPGSKPVIIMFLNISVELLQNKSKSLPGSEGVSNATEILLNDLAAKTGKKNRNCEQANLKINKPQWTQTY